MMENLFGGQIWDPPSTPKVDTNSESNHNLERQETKKRNKMEEEAYVKQTDKAGTKRQLQVDDAFSAENVLGNNPIQQECPKAGALWRTRDAQQICQNVCSSYIQLEQDCYLISYTGLVRQQDGHLSPTGKSRAKDGILNHKNPLPLEYQGSSVLIGYQDLMLAKLRKSCQFMTQVWEPWSKSNYSTNLNTPIMLERLLPQNKKGYSPIMLISRKNWLVAGWWQEQPEGRHQSPPPTLITTPKDITRIAAPLKIVTNRKPVTDIDPELNHRVKTRKRIIEAHIWKEQNNNLWVIVAENAVTFWDSYDWLTALLWHIETWLDQQGVLFFVVRHGFLFLLLEKFIHMMVWQIASGISILWFGDWLRTVHWHSKVKTKWTFRWRGIEEIMRLLKLTWPRFLTLHGKCARTTQRALELCSMKAATSHEPEVIV